jgi:hypothetical protein
MSIIEMREHKLQVRSLDDLRETIRTEREYDYTLAFKGRKDRNEILELHFARLIYSI